MSTDTRTHPTEPPTTKPTISRIAVGLDGFAEGDDALVLSAALARAVHAELMLVAVHPDPLVVLPPGMSWKGLHEQAETMLCEARDARAPAARIAVETDISVSRGLHRVVWREHRDLLVMGSSRRAREGTVRIGKRTRQLLCHFECPLAVAPRGLHRAGEPSLGRIGVGYNGGEEADAAIALAGSIAVAAGAELHVRGVVDDRIPQIAWAAGTPLPDWERLTSEKVDSLGERAAIAARATGAQAQASIQRGRPADSLLELSREVDLLVIGSRQWGPVARVLLGTTGESLLHDAACSVLVVPRPHG